jgi:hypothetical protein
MRAAGKHDEESQKQYIEQAILARLKQLEEENERLKTRYEDSADALRAILDRLAQIDGIQSGGHLRARIDHHFSEGGLPMHLRQAAKGECDIRTVR